MDVALNPAPVRWPFWWLALAWLCANIPTPARLELIDWLSGLQHFSHQTQLSTQVRAALKTAPPTTTVAASKAIPTKAAFPLAVSDNLVKKTELASGPAEEALGPPRSQRHRYFSGDYVRPDGLRTEPPLPPPRR